MGRNITEAEAEERLLQELQHHLSGWLSKIVEDFSEEHYENELKQLKSDPVYSQFGFAIPEYVLIRLMGRLSISIGRRLGEIYDKVPRFLTAYRFDLKPDEIAPLFGKLQLDIGIPLERLSGEDQDHVKSVFNEYFPGSDIGNGIGIEIRYNFNPNDSSRLRKDEDMSSKLQSGGLFPIYLIFSEISPRDEAIERLKRAGWNFLIGKHADDFMNKLVGMDFSKILGGQKIQKYIRSEIDALMSEMLNSEAFKLGSETDNKKPKIE
jgi:hypothetical protein